MSDRITRRRLLLVLVLLSAAGVVALSGPSSDDLRRDGDGMVEAVEHFHRTRGRYPETLEEVGVVPPTTRYAPWRYVCYDEHYRLSVGDVDQDGWVLTYRSSVGEWRLEE